MSVRVCVCVKKSHERFAESIVRVAVAAPLFIADDNVWVRGAHFDDALVSVMYRMQMLTGNEDTKQSPKFAQQCTGVSLVLMPNGGVAYVLVSSPRMPDGYVRHAALPLQLERPRDSASDELQEQDQVRRIDLARFSESCALVGEEQHEGDRSHEWGKREAHQIICDFFQVGYGESDALSLYAATSGLKFCFAGDETGAPGGAPCVGGGPCVCVTAAGDLILENPGTGWCASLCGTG